jgi:hypothetical protein
MRNIFSSLFSLPSSLFFLKENPLMSNFLEKRADGFLYSRFVGTVDDTAVEAFKQSVAPHLAEATAENPLHFIADATDEGSWSFSARREFTSYFEDKRLGKVAIINANRFTRVVATFLMKAPGRSDEVSFFDNEKQATKWLAGK